MIYMLGGGFDARARVDAWFCSWLKLARVPKRAIDRIGETPREWIRLQGLHARHVVDGTCQRVPPAGAL